MTQVVCVNAHDRCFLGGPCPYCEPRKKKMQPDLFDQRSGEDLKEAGLRQVESGGLEWLMLARDRLHQHCLENPGCEVTSDDVHRLAPKPDWLHNNILGAVFRDSRWRATGEWRPTQRREGHARRIAVYRLRGEET